MRRSGERDTHFRSAQWKRDPFLSELPLVRAWACIVLSWSQHVLWFNRSSQCSSERHQHIHLQPEGMQLFHFSIFHMSAFLQNQSNHSTKKMWFQLPLPTGRGFSPYRMLCHGAEHLHPTIFLLRLLSALTWDSYPAMREKTELLTYVLLLQPPAQKKGN